MTSVASLPSVVERSAPTYLFLGVSMRVLLSSQQTGGQFTMIEGTMPPGGDGGLHLHRFEDESMTILEGELEVTIGDDVTVLRAGQSYFAPRGVPQRLRNLGKVPTRSLLVTTPGGFDEFIVKAGLRVEGAMPAKPAEPPTPAQMVALLEMARTHGIEVLIPPGA
ncbi:cupin domain-containing protein [Pandoraea capi]|nr:cupin domain-containing protein [Pandoraea sp. LA3]MDN4586450.1 cupin domain-containing protein [Pandoraea capi]